MKGKRISILTYEGDRFERELLQRKLLAVLAENRVEGATVTRAAAGYTRGMGLTTRLLVDAGGRLPILVEFVASQEQFDRVLPIIKPMVGSRPITTAEVEIETVMNS
jgi:PII-like signaling protein